MTLEISQSVSLTGCCLRECICGRTVHRCKSQQDIEEFRSVLPQIVLKEVLEAVQPVTRITAALMWARLKGAVNDYQFGDITKHCVQTVTGKPSNQYQFGDITKSLTHSVRTRF